MYTFLCEDSIDGILSGIYEAWAGGYCRDDIVMKAGTAGNYQLFMEYKKIPTDRVLAGKVADTVRRRFGEEIYEEICYALWSREEDKADAVYRMIRYGIESRRGRGIGDDLTQESVQRTFQLFRNVHNEAHHYLGFLRFAELENHILYAEAEPRNYILEPLAAHFADRMPGENWIICDKGRGKVALHQAFGQWLIAEENMVTEWTRCRKNGTEMEYQEMWRIFLKSISIEARTNPKLQRQNLPLRFRQYML